MLKRKSNKNKSGFTITEVLVAAVLGMLLMGSMISFFAFLRKTFVEQTQINTMQGETRTAFDLMTRDIRMSGYGLVDDEADDALWIAKINVNAAITQNPWITDGGGTNPDSIQCIGAFDPPVAELAFRLNSGIGVLSYNSTGGTPAFNTTDHQLICIGGVETARIISHIGGLITFSTKPNELRGCKFDYPVGTSIDLIKTITYELSNTAGEIFLKRKDSTQSYSADWESALASNIEDFQITRSNDVYTVTLVGRTERPMPNTTGDGYKRYTLNTTIKPKNM